MKKIIAILFSFITVFGFCDIIAITEDGRKVLLKDNGTWQYIDNKNDIDKIKRQIEITVIQAGITTDYDDNQLPAFQLKIKNNSDTTIYRMSVIVYFIDKNGKIFFEKEFYPVIRGTYNLDRVKELKPNYSFIYPEIGKVMTVSEIDLNEWDIGKIKVKVNEIKIEKSN